LLRGTAVEVRLEAEGEAEKRLLRETYDVDSVTPAAQTSTQFVGFDADSLDRLRGRVGVALGNRHTRPRIAFGIPASVAAQSYRRVKRGYSSYVSYACEPFAGLVLREAACDLRLDMRIEYRDYFDPISLFVRVPLDSLDVFRVGPALSGAIRKGRFRGDVRFAYLSERYWRRVDLRSARVTDAEVRVMLEPGRIVGIGLRGGYEYRVEDRRFVEYDSTVQRYLVSRSVISGILSRVRDDWTVR